MHFIKLGSSSILLLSLWVCSASAQSPDQEITLELGGWVQPRYEYSIRDGAENLSSFYLRRVRLDVHGQAYWPELTYRVLPEMARTAVLRDAWLNYAFSLAAEVRIGQFTVPFQWHRYVSPRRQHFAERGVPSEAFGFPAGRDIGIMLHGQNPAGTLAYGIGIFDGLGRNTELSNSDGHMASARLTWAARGPLPREESDLAYLEEPAVAVGVGIQAANKNEARAWDLGRSEVGNPRGNYVVGTADVNLRWKGFSLVADGYLRRVRPDDPTIGSYSEWGTMVSAGYFLVPGRLEVVARYSDLYLDADAPEPPEGELAAGLNIYFRGHDVKTRIQFFSEHGHYPAVIGHDGVFLVEFHVQF